MFLRSLHNQPTSGREGLVKIKVPGPQPKEPPGSPCISGVTALAFLQPGVLSLLKRLGLSAYIHGVNTLRKRSEWRKDSIDSVDSIRQCYVDDADQVGSSAFLSTS